MKKVLQGTSWRRWNLGWVLSTGKVSSATMKNFGQRKIPRQKQEVRVFREFLRNC